MSISRDDLIPGAVLSRCQWTDGDTVCAEEFQVAHSAHDLAKWSANEGKCREIILPMVKEYGDYNVAPYECPKHLHEREKEYLMALGRRGKSKKEPEAAAVAVPDNTEQETNVSDNFDWDNQDNGEQGAVATEEAPAQESTEAAPAKEEGPKLSDEFPVDSYVKLVKTDWKNNYGQVVGHADKRNVLYLSVKLLCYADGRPRPEGKQIVADVRPASVEKADSLPEPPKQEEKAEAPAES